MLKISRPGKPPAFVQIDIGDVGATVERFEAIGEDHARAFQLRCPLHRKRGSLHHVIGCDASRSRLRC